MQFTITCPECGTALSADETQVGNFISCPVCRHQMPIPKFSMSRPTIEQQKQGAAKPAEETVQDTETAASAPAAAAPVPEDSTLSPEVSQESDTDPASEKTDRKKKKTTGSAQKKRTGESAERKSAASRKDRGESNKEPEDDSSPKKKDQGKKGTDDLTFSFTESFWVITICIGIPILLTLWMEWPRTVFWCAFPLWGFSTFTLLISNRKKTGVLALAVVLGWGWWVHTAAQVPFERRKIMTVECEIVTDGNIRKYQNCEIRLFKRCPEAEDLFQEGIMYQRILQKNKAKLQEELLLTKIKLEKTLRKKGDPKKGVGTLTAVEKGEYTLWASSQDENVEFFWVTHVTKDTAPAQIQLSSVRDCWIMPK